MSVKNLWSYFKITSLKTSNQEENPCGDESGEIQSGVSCRAGCVLQRVRLDISPLPYDVRSNEESIRNSEDVRKSARCKQVIRSSVCKGTRYVCCLKTNY